jgi:hypothetical protein
MFSSTFLYHLADVLGPNSGKKQRDQDNSPIHASEEGLAQILSEEIRWVY